MEESRSRCVVVQPETSKSGPGAARRWRECGGGQEARPGPVTPPRVDITADFRGLAGQDAGIDELARVLQDCFARPSCFQVGNVPQPDIIEFDAFIDPDGDPSARPEPVVRFYYRDAEGLPGIAEMTARLGAIVKRHLAEAAPTLDRFKQYLAIWEPYRLVIWIT